MTHSCITDAVVEQACIAMCKVANEDGNINHWDLLEESERNDIRKAVRVSIETAFPLIYEEFLKQDGVITYSTARAFAKDMYAPNRI